MYEIEFTIEAIQDLESFRKFEHRKIIAGIQVQLENEPAVETRNRKRLRPNDVAEWELRIGKYRVFYDVYEKVRTVKVEGIGRKEGNRLLLHGEEYKL